MGIPIAIGPMQNPEPPWEESRDSYMNWRTEAQK